MGSLFKPKTQTIAPPQEAEFYTQIDEVNKVKTEKVKQPDGSYAIVTSRMPLTAEEQALQDKYKAIETDSLAWIDKLSTDFNRADIPWLDQYLTDYETSARIGLEQGVATRTNQEERALARYGVEDSTSAAQTRSMRGADFRAANEQVSRDMSTIEQQARDSELGKQVNLYSLATGQQATQLNNLMTSSAQQNANALGQQQIKQGYYNSVANVNATNAKNTQDANQAFYQNLIGLAKVGASAYGGGA